MKEILFISIQVKESDKSQMHIKIREFCMLCKLRETCSALVEVCVLRQIKSNICTEKNIWGSLAC